MVMVGQLSKYGLETYYNSRIVAEVFMHNIVKFHGMLKFIQITGHFFSDVFSLPSTIRWPVRGTKQMSRNIFEVPHISEYKELV